MRRETFLAFLPGTDEIIAAAEARHWGIRRLRSIESRENHAAISLERDKGFYARAVEGDATRVMLEHCF